MFEEVLGSSESLFVVVSSTAVTRGGFRLRGYAGSTGRIDVIARCIVASQLSSDSGFVGVLLGPPSPPKVLVVKPACLGGGVSEKGVVLEISRALKYERTRCMEVLDLDVERLIHLIGRSGFRHVLLREDGVNIFTKPELVSGRVAFYLGSHVDMPRWVEDLLESRGATVVSVGPHSLHSEHVILAILMLRGVLG